MSSNIWPSDAAWAFPFATPACSLRGFARHVQAIGHRGPLTVDVMADWARRDSHGSDDPKHLGAPAEALALVRALAAAVRTAHRSPRRHDLRPHPERQAPHIYSEPEIVDLLAAARRLGPASAFVASSTRRCSV